jgi:hypothetical protein
MKEADTTKLNSSSNKTHRSFFMYSTASYLSPEDFGLLLEWKPQPPHPATDTILSVIGGGERYLYGNFINHVVSHQAWKLRVILRS